MQKTLEDAAPTSSIYKEDIWETVSNKNKKLLLLTHRCYNFAAKQPKFYHISCYLELGCVNAISFIPSSF